MLLFARGGNLKDKTWGKTESIGGKGVIIAIVRSTVLRPTISY